MPWLLAEKKPQTAWIHYKQIHSALILLSDGRRSLRDAERSCQNIVPGNRPTHSKGVKTMFKRILIVLAVVVAASQTLESAAQERAPEGRERKAVVAEEGAQAVGAETGAEELLSPKNCEVNYFLDNAGTISTGWQSLGTVGGFLVNKKKQCKKKAIAACALAKQKLLVYAPVESGNFNSICSKGKLDVYFDTMVEGKINSKDGYCSTSVSCPWLNRDRPSGKGDYETLNDFVKAGQTCANPAAVECKTTGGVFWNKVLPVPQAYICNTKVGGVCENAKNEGKCLDYQVRFLCL
jgi:Mucin-2 protein WxxW repeating region